MQKLTQNQQKCNFSSTGTVLLDEMGGQGDGFLWNELRQQFGTEEPSPRNRIARFIGEEGASVRHFTLGTIGGVRGDGSAVRKMQAFFIQQNRPLVHASLQCGCPPKKRFHFMWHEMECLGVCLYETSTVFRNHFFFFSIWRVNFTSACLSWKSCFLVRILENFSKYLASISPSWMRVRDSADAAAS